MHNDSPKWMLRSALARGVIKLDVVYLQSVGTEINRWVWEEEDGDNDTLIPEYPDIIGWREKSDGTREQVVYHKGLGRDGWRPCPPKQG